MTRPDLEAALARASATLRRSLETVSVTAVVTTGAGAGAGLAGAGRSAGMSRKSCIHQVSDSRAPVRFHPACCSGNAATVAWPWQAELGGSVRGKPQTPPGGLVASQTHAWMHEQVCVPRNGSQPASCKGTSVRSGLHDSFPCGRFSDS